MVVVLEVVAVFCGGFVVHGVEVLRLCRTLCQRFGLGAARFGMSGMSGMRFGGAGGGGYLFYIILHTARKFP